MHFTQFRAVNFGPFEDLSLSLERGSIGVFGANGSGKTTLLNGLYGCITNDFSRFSGLKSDCIRNTAEPKSESYVYGRLEHGGHVVSVKRGLYPARTSVTVDDGKEIADANKAQEAIDAALGVDRRMLSMYAFKPQEGLYDFISSQPADRARAFAVLCRTEACEHIWDFLGRFLSKNADVNAVIVDNSDELVTDISQLESSASELEAAIAAESELLMTSKSEQSAREILRRRDRLEDLNADLSTERARRDEARSAFKDAKDRKGKRESKWKALKSEAEALRGPADEARAALKSWQQYAKQKAKRRQLKDEADQLKAEEKKNQPPPPRDDLEVASIESLKQEVWEIEQEFASAKAVADQFHNTGISACPTCGTPVDSLHDHVEAQKALTKELPKKIKELEDQIEEVYEYNASIRQYNKWLASWKSRSEANAKAREALTDLEAPDGTQAEFTSAVEAYEHAVAQAVVAETSYDEMAERYAQAEAAGTQAARRVAELEAAIEENAEPDERVAKARARLEEHAAASKNVARLQGQLEGLRNQITSKQADLSKLRSRLKRTKKVRRAAAIAQELREVMHRDGLPRRVAQGNLSRMEGDINAGLEAFGDPYWVETDSNLTFVAHKPGEPPQPAARLSTGQKVVLALAFWPAVASLWSSDLGILALDEPTANLDEWNKKFLADAIGRLTASVRGSRQLIMVTHDQDLRTSFDQVIELGG